MTAALVLAALIADGLALGYLAGRIHQQRLERRRRQAPVEPTGALTAGAQAYLADAVKRVTTIPGRVCVFEMNGDRHLALMDRAEFNKLVIQSGRLAADAGELDGGS